VGLNIVEPIYIFTQSLRNVLYFSFSIFLYYVIYLVIIIWNAAAGATTAVPTVILRVRHALDFPEDPWYVRIYDK